MKNHPARLAKFTLVSWIGQTDLNAAQGDATAGIGPIAQAAAFKNFTRLVLFTLSSPMHFGEIYQVARQVLSELMAESAPALTIHLSPGMAAVWILLTKTRFPAELIQSSVAHGVEVVAVPFDIAAEFLPDLLHQADRRLGDLIAGNPPTRTEFGEIIHRSAVMQRLLRRAEKVALRSVPVLIEGESGTGKELLARAIHAASPRRDRPFIAVNCGAIPAELVEAELFGHEKGAFTGAARERKGVFEAADGGTLFLDEVGELPLVAQVKNLDETEVRKSENLAPYIRSRILQSGDEKLVRILKTLPDESWTRLRDILL